MPGMTPNGLAYPLSSDAPNVWSDLQALAEDIDTFIDTAPTAPTGVVPDYDILAGNQELTFSATWASVPTSLSFALSPTDEGLYEVELYALVYGSGGTGGNIGNTSFRINGSNCTRDGRVFMQGTANVTSADDVETFQMDSSSALLDYVTGRYVIGGSVSTACWMRALFEITDVQAGGGLIYTQYFSNPPAGSTAFIRDGSYLKYTKIS